MSYAQTFETRNGCLPLDYHGEPKSFKPRKWPEITPAMHEKIKRLYRDRVRCSGEIREFSKRHNIPRWKITKYAQRMGWIEKQRKEPDWSEGELRILHQSGHHSPEIIQKRLKKAGYARSVTGIVIKRKRERIPSNLNGQSARSLALCLGEDMHFVTRMIKTGLLKATKRSTNRTPQQGGDIWHIKDKDVREFILANPELIDLRKIEKHWFIDILTGI
jgi:hypothetical protein